MTTTATFAIMMNEEDTIMNKIKLFEIVDVAKMNDLIKSQSFVDIYPCVIEKRECRTVFATPSLQLSAYAKNYMKKYNAVPVEYSRKTKMGRVYPKGSLGLCSIPRVVRNTLIRKTYYDFDIVNCHASLLRAILVANEYDLDECKQFNEYCTHRADFLHEVSELMGVGKSQAKDFFNTVICGGTFERWCNAQGTTHALSDDNADLILRMCEYEQDIKNITTLLIDENAELFQNHCDVYRKEKKDKHNERGSFIAKLMQEWELRLVGIVLNWVMNKTEISRHHIKDGTPYHVASYQFDGIQLLKERVDAYKGGLGGFVQELNKITAELTGLQGVEWICKPMDEYYEGFEKEQADAEIDCHMKQQISERMAAVTESAYDLMKGAFEKNHCKIVSSGVYLECMEDGTVSVHKPKTMCDKFLHMSCRKNQFGGNIPFIDDWMRDPEIRRYDTMEFYPNASDCPHTCFNLWTPFAAERITEWSPDTEALEMILKHMYIICNHDQSAYEQLMEWMAQMVQFPHIKSICPTLISEGGAGKSTVVDLIVCMFGRNKVVSTSVPERDVWGNFNSAMQNGFLVNIDDCDAVGSSFQEKMKTLIDSPTLTINKKGQDTFDIKSFHRFIITTNKYNGILREGKDGRRNLIIRSSDELIGNFIYFQNFRSKCIDKQNAVKTFYEYLKALPNVRSKITKPTATAYQKDLAELSEKPIKTWLKEFIQMCVADRIEMVLRITQQGNPAQETIPDGDHIIEHKSSDMHTLFNEFSKSNKLEYGVSVLKFGVMLKTLRYDNAISVKKTNTCNKTCINITILAEKFEAEGW